MFLTTSTPRQMTVDTVELRSRNEVLTIFELSPSACSEGDEESLPDQFASTSDKEFLDPAIGSEAEMGIGKEAEGESLRLTAACV